MNTNNPENQINQSEIDNTKTSEINPSKTRRSNSKRGAALDKKSKSFIIKVEFPARTLSMIRSTMKNKYRYYNDSHLRDFLKQSIPQIVEDNISKFVDALFVPSDQTSHKGTNSLEGTDEQE